MNDEVCRLTSGGKYTSSKRGLVKRSKIVFGIWLVVLLRLEPNDRHRLGHLGWELIGDLLSISVPSCAINESTIDVDTILRLCFNLFWSLCFLDLEGEGKSIDSNLVLSCMGLKDTSHETLREEHTRKPIRGWVSVVEPESHEIYSLKEVLEPRGEWLKTWITNLGPVEWYSVVLDLQVHGV